MSHFINLKAATSARDSNFCLLHSIILPNTCKWIYLIKYFLWSLPNTYKIIFLNQECNSPFHAENPKILCFNTQNDKKKTRVSDLSTDPTHEPLMRGNGCQGVVSFVRQHIALRVKGYESPNSITCELLIKTFTIMYSKMISVLLQDIC